MVRLYKNSVYWNKKQSHNSVEKKNNKCVKEYPVDFSNLLYIYRT